MGARAFPLCNFEVLYLIEQSFMYSDEQVHNLSNIWGYAAIKSL